MNQPPFANRLSEDYVASESISCGLARGDKVEWVNDIPQLAFNRLSQLAEAYDLHVLSTLDYWGDLGDANEGIGAALTRAQSADLAVELDFIRSVVNDPVTDRYAAELSHLAVKVSRSPFTDQTLRIVGP